MAFAPHPYRTALEKRDPALLVRSLHPDVSFYSPAFEAAICGRDNVLALFAVLAGVFEDPVIVDELRGQRGRAIAFQLRVDGHPIEGVDYIKLDGSGLVREIKVTMRPLKSLQVLADRMADPVASLQHASPVE